MTIKNINQINKEKIRIISKLKSNEISELCKSYLLKSYDDKKYFKGLEELHDYYLQNQQPNNLSEYEKLHNAYCACLGFYKGLNEYSYNQKKEKVNILLLGIHKNVSDTLFICEKNLEILKMLLSKNDNNLDDIIEELYLLTTLKYYHLIEYTYMLKNTCDNITNFNELLKPLNNSKSDLNEIYERLLKYSNKEHKEYFESIFNEVANFLNQFSEFENNKKIKKIRDNINKKYGN